MASNRGYTTATKVRDVLAGQVVTYITDAMIDAEINRIEGLIDTQLKIGGGGQAAFAWTTGTVPDWVLEAAATYGAAMMCASLSAASMNSLEQLVNIQNHCAYKFKTAMDRIESQDLGTFIKEQHAGDV